jgi:hypothetical protein
MSRFTTFFAAIIVLTFFGSAATTSQAQQPFSNIYQSPTVSPYLNLTNNRGQGQTNYQTLVRPLIEQQQQNITQQQQIQHLSQQQQALAAGGLTRPARGISTNIRGTGHVAGFMVHGNYYPRANTSTADPIMRRLVTLDYTQ